MGGPSGTLVLQPMENGACLTVNIVDDDLHEGNEMFMFRLSNAMNATLGSPSEVSITIIDNGESRVMSARLNKYLFIVIVVTFNPTHTCCVFMSPVCCVTCTVGVQNVQ